MCMIRCPTPNLSYTTFTEELEKLLNDYKNTQEAKPKHINHTHGSNKPRMRVQEHADPDPARSVECSITTARREKERETEAQRGLTVLKLKMMLLNSNKLY